MIIAGEALVKEIEKKFRERDIRLIELKKSGKTSREIGEILFLSKKTIENIFHHLYRKFDCRNFFDLNNYYEKQLHDKNKYPEKCPNPFLNKVSS